MDAFTPKREHVVRVGPLANLEALTRDLGYDPLPVFRELNVDPAWLRDPNHLVPYVRSSHLLHKLVDLTGCEHFCLLLGQMANPSLLGMPGFLACTATTVEQALGMLAENLDLHDEVGTVTINVGLEFSTFAHSVELDGVAAVDQINDLSITVFCKVMRYLCGNDWNPIAVKLERREPLNRRPFRQFFRTVVYYNSPVSEVTFDNQCLQNRPPEANGLLFRHLEQEAQLMHDLHGDKLSKSLPAILRRSLVTGKFSAREVAETVGLHERTLARRLKESGTSFRTELDAARQNLSEQLLEYTDMSISDIATTLGYSDASGFIRAFERWYCTSPKAWRKTLEKV